MRSLADDLRARSDDQLAALEGAVAEIERSAAEGDLSGFLLADRDFHIGLLELTGQWYWGPTPYVLRLLPDGWLDDPEDLCVPAGADLMHSGG